MIYVLHFGAEAPIHSAHKTLESAKLAAQADYDNGTDTTTPLEWLQTERLTPARDSSEEPTKHIEWVGENPGDNYPALIIELPIE